MRTKDLTIVALRLYGLLLFFDCLPTLYRIPMHWQISMQSSGPFTRSMLLIDDAITFGLYFVVGALLLLLADRIGELVIPSGSDQGAASQVQPVSLMRMSLGIAGIVFFVHGLQSLAYSCATWLFIRQEPFGRYVKIPMQDKGKIAEGIVTVLVGIALFAGREGLANFALHLRTLGRVTDGGHEGGDKQASFEQKEEP